jgi:hypothetical protein
MSKLRELLDEMAEQRGRLVTCPLRSATTSNLSLTQ